MQRISDNFYLLLLEPLRNKWIRKVMQFVIEMSRETDSWLFFGFFSDFQIIRCVQTNLYATFKRFLNGFHARLKRNRSRCAPRSWEVRQLSKPVLFDSENARVRIVDRHADHPLWFILSDPTAPPRSPLQNSNAVLIFFVRSRSDLHYPVWPTKLRFEFTFVSCPQSTRSHTRPLQFGLPDRSICHACQFGFPDRFHVGIISDFQSKKEGVEAVRQRIIERRKS